MNVGGIMMTFRQKGILFWEGQFSLLIFMITSVILMVYLRQVQPALLIVSMIVLAVFVAQFCLKKEYVTVNADGIACRKGEKLLWFYAWADMKELRIGNRFRNPSVEIIPKNDDGKTVYERQHYFQLGFTAKKALQKYGTIQLNHA